jgi:hypothetical protein
MSGYREARFWAHAVLGLLGLAFVVLPSPVNARQAAKMPKGSGSRAATSDSVTAVSRTGDFKAQSGEADILLPQGVGVSAGWVMGVTGDAVNPAQDPPSKNKLDLAPYLHVNIGFGDEDVFSADVKLILANFARLVNKANISDFNPDSSGSSVRRAMITDFTVRTPVWHCWSNGGILIDIVNTGFVFDAEGDSEEESAEDAASYLFSGITLVGAYPKQKCRAAADLLFGVSELMTGDEAFDFSKHSHPSFRIRPRLWVRFDGGLGKGRPLDIGFWGDLGVDKKSGDAVTAFVATQLFP